MTEGSEIIVTAKESREKEGAPLFFVEQFKNEKLREPCTTTAKCCVLFNANREFCLEDEIKNSPIEGSYRL